MHTISSGLLAPAIVVLLLLLAVSGELGLLVDLTERRRMKVNVPELVEFFQGKDAGSIMSGIENSNLFRRQKAVLGS